MLDVSPKVYRARKHGDHAPHFTEYKSSLSRRRISATPVERVCSPFESSSLWTERKTEVMEILRSTSNGEFRKIQKLKVSVVCARVKKVVLVL